MAEKSTAPTERPDGAKLIAEECWRQRALKPDGEGWSEASKHLETLWPWGAGWWKPSEPKRMLVKAGALVAAEIDRQERLAAPVQEVDCGA